MTENTTASGAADRPEALKLASILRGLDTRHYFGNKKLVAAADELERLHALAASAPVAPSQPDWRELCRRLHVELFHCDKQMTCSLNEDGEPIWRTGPEVRDVLSDAKAALEANPITPEAAPVAPAPQPAPTPYPTDAQVDAVYEQTMGQHLRSQDAPAVRRFGRAMFLCAWNAATPAVAPAPITDAEQAAWHAGLDEGRSQARAPLQQGEYPEPQQDSDDDPASLGAYLAAWAGGVHSRTKNDTGAAEEWISVSVERLGHAAAALIAARGAAQAQPATVAEDADPLQGAANWLVASHTITSATTLGGRLCIGYNRAERLFNAARAQAAQPEGGA